jgi:hypothetical protein
VSADCPEFVVEEVGATEDGLLEVGFEEEGV